ncbi:MAG: PASTA domain-containing protein, partial [Lachnospiraceae bacterium]|nr:PASTA domain-containing protein [Lachnospiraceae bacterium]
PDRRYQSMGDLIKDLKQALLTPDVDFVVRDEQDILGGTRTVSDEDMAKIKSSSGRGLYDEDDSHMMKLAPGATGSLPKEEYYEDNYSGESYEEGYNEGEYSSDYQNGEYESEGYREEGYEAEGYNDAYNEVYNSESGLENEEDYNPKMEKITTIIAIAAGVIIVGIIIVLAVTIIGKMGSKTPAQPADTQTETTSPVIGEDEQVQPTVEMVKLPAMVGKDIDSVRNELFALGLTVNPVYEESSTVDAGLVIEADGVSEGSEVQKGTIINLKVSSGVSGIQIPAVAGATYESAVNALTKAGFNVTKIEQFDDNIAEGYVVGVIPEVGSTVPKGSTIQIIVSKGVEDTTVKVPNVVGIPTEDALAKLIEAGLTVGKTTSVNSDTIEKDMICQQGVTADTYVEKGTAVDLQISLGPKAVTYKYEAEIAAPSATEAPDYVSGVTVSFVVKDGNGKAFIEASTVSFPYKPATCYGITPAEGTIEFTYDVVKQTESTDAEGNKVINTTTEKKTFTRPVTFVQE